MIIQKVRIKEGYILREFGGEFNIFNEKDGAGAVISMNSINELGCFLWSRLEKHATYNELIQAVAVRNDLDEEESRMEVEELLAKLINAGVVDII
ncbi:PqqD family peptide modification chaperone [Anaerocolumna sp. MB42-C2]|uniref:PqqD family peptide modification chaperone n=1 Tax=Anaerocolumna sp. MB42-C2 TaxID=3070997 RepID=UPI0027E0E01D|nr:PqqD family peptide modification chaperone [Anaerocolumna sp. MB42-C2]WMJ88816.1 PqqD family peptide modification chaperone [Anaerocolumna sp. MB42-C2]